MFLFVDVHGGEGFCKFDKFLFEHWNFHAHVFTFYFTEEFLKGIFLLIRVSLLHLLYAEDVVWLYYLEKFFKNVTIFLKLFASDGIEVVAECHEYSIWV